MNYAIYGANGYIGKELFNYLYSRGHNVAAIDFKDIDLSRNFTREEVASKFIKSIQVDAPIVFVNCAAIANTSSKNTFDIVTNVSIVINELKIVRKYDTFIQISSRYSFLDTPYGNSKRLCDEILEKFDICKTYSLKINYPFGAISTLPNNGIIGKIFRHESLTLFTEALDNRSLFNYIGDILEIVEKIGNGNVKQFEVIVNGYEWTLREFLRIYESFNGSILSLEGSNPNFKPISIGNVENGFGPSDRTYDEMFKNKFI